MDAKVKPRGSDAGAGHTFRWIGIVGAGQMGNGIAHVCALSGYHVAINDLKKEAFDRAMATIEKNLARQVSRGLVKDEAMRTAPQAAARAIRALPPAPTRKQLTATPHQPTRSTR